MDTKTLKESVLVTTNYGLLRDQLSLSEKARMNHRTPKDPLPKQRLESRARLEVHRVGLKLLARVQLRQRWVVILPYQQDRSFGREALVADIRRHRCDVARLHRDAGPRDAGVAVADLPLDLVAQLHEPFDAVVAVDHRQNELFGRRANQAVLHRRAYGRVPLHVRARHVAKKVERVNLVLEARLGVDLGLRLVDVEELPVHLVAGRVAA